MFFSIPDIYYQYLLCVLTQAISIFDFVKSFFKFSFAFVRTSPSYVSSLSSIDIFKYTPNPTTGQPSTYVSNDYIHLFISRDPIPKSDLSVMLSLLKQTTFHLDMGEGTQHYLDVDFFHSSYISFSSLESLSSSFRKEQSEYALYSLPST